MDFSRFDFHPEDRVKQWKELHRKTEIWCSRRLGHRDSKCLLRMTDNLQSIFVGSPRIGAPQKFDPLAALPYELVEPATQRKISARKRKIHTCNWNGGYKGGKKPSELALCRFRPKNNGEKMKVTSSGNSRNLNRRLYLCNAPPHTLP